MNRRTDYSQQNVPMIVRAHGLEKIKRVSLSGESVILVCVCERVFVTLCLGGEDFWNFCGVVHVVFVLIAPFRY